MRAPLSPRAHTHTHTFLHELPPAFGPLAQLLRVALLDARALVKAVHQVVAQPVPIIHALHHALVVPHLTDTHTEALQTRDANGETNTRGD